MADPTLCCALVCLTLGLITPVSSQRQTHDTPKASCPNCPPGEEHNQTCEEGLEHKVSCVPCVQGETYRSFKHYYEDNTCKTCLNCSAFYNRQTDYKCRRELNAECGDCLPGFTDDGRRTMGDGSLLSCRENEVVTKENNRTTVEKGMDYKVLSICLGVIVLIALVCGGCYCLKWLIKKLQRRRMDTLVPEELSAVVMWDPCAPNYVDELPTSEMTPLNTSQDSEDQPERQMDNSISGTDGTPSQADYLVSTSTIPSKGNTNSSGYSSREVLTSDSVADTTDLSDLHLQRRLEPSLQDTELPHRDQHHRIKDEDPITYAQPDHTEVQGDQSQPPRTQPNSPPNSEQNYRCPHHCSVQDPRVVANIWTTVNVCPNCPCALSKGTVNACSNCPCASSKANTTKPSDQDTQPEQHAESAQAETETEVKRPTQETEQEEENPTETSPIVESKGLESYSVQETALLDSNQGINR